MCGRFTLTVPSYEELAAAFGVDPLPGMAEAYRPRYNVAPTDPSYIARTTSSGARELTLARWGLVPHWAKTIDQAGRPINARAETVLQKPAFRDAVARRRCVVATDGFFEWDKRQGRRQPLWFRPAHGGPLLLAGVYERWTDPGSGERLMTFSILTTEAGPDVAVVHDRMPVVLAPRDLDVWLAKAPGGAEPQVTSDVRALLAPAPRGTLVSQPVSRRVGSPKNDDPSVLDPDPEPPGPVPARRGARRKGGETLPLFADTTVSRAKR